MRVTVPVFDVDGAGWQALTYQQYYNEVTRAAKAFIKVSYFNLSCYPRASCVGRNRCIVFTGVCTVCVFVCLCVCVAAQKLQKSY